MDSRDLERLIGKVKTGRLSRRGFLTKMAAVGLTAPMANQLLAFGGVAMAQTATGPEPTKRGGGGPLKLLWWQGATLLNPHFATGTKDQEGSRLFYEPLAGWDKDGNLVAQLAAEIPSRENGGLAADGKSVTWKLKKGVKWHDGKDFTADDCVFNWEYSLDPATAAVSIGAYKGTTVEKIDSHTVKVSFEKPTPFWANAFVGNYGMLIPKHLFADYIGAKSRDAPNNLKPVGTGAFKFADFKPGDLVKGDLNPDYHVPNRPFFDSVEMKGGGDAVSAARAVLQTGEYDYAWNMQVEDEILLKLEKEGGKGRVVASPGGDIEFILINCNDPWTEVEGERASMKAKHPILNDMAVRKALALLVDKNSIEKFIYGRGGFATANFLNNPERFRSKATSFEFSVEKATKLLDDAGWKPGAGGVREKDGKKLKFVYQTSINSPRQKTQQIVKQACQKAGIDLELKSITASVFFSSDVANPDTYTKFYTDLEMYTTTMTQPDPEVFMNQYCSWEVSSKDNKWQGRNITRWISPEYDQAYKDAQGELDPLKRAALYIKMNELVVNGHAVIPVVSRPKVTAITNKLRTIDSGWDNNVYRIAYWTRET